MEDMIKSIAAALRVLNPGEARARPPLTPDTAPRDNCDKPRDNRDTFPPRAT